jgi:hypothetical protein
MTVNAFIVTQVGLDAAVTSASPGGITLILSTFKVGSGFGYTPTKLDTALHGSVLYTSTISGFSTGSDGSLIVDCTMSVEAGPFDFGEIGIYTSTGQLFALLALPALEHKYTSLGSTVASTFTFKAYLRLGQVGGIITIDTGSGGGGGGTSNFVYTMNSGQPPALWGTTDSGVNSQVWNPSNFNVSTAKNIVNTGAASYAATSHTFYAADGTSHLADISASGIITCVNLAITSDMDFKTNVEKIEDGAALEILRTLDGITYELLDHPGERHPGVPAQQLEELFPVGVRRDANGKRAVSYAQTFGALLPPAVRAILQRMDSLADEISDLEDKLDRVYREVM